MLTVIKSGNEQHEFLTQQYPVGTYVIVDGNPALQGSSNKKEPQFHKDLRIKALKVGDTIVGGTTIPYQGRKYHINPWIK